MHNLQGRPREGNAIANSWISGAALTVIQSIIRPQTPLQINLEARGFKLALIIEDGMGKDLNGAS